MAGTDVILGASDEYAMIVRSEGFDLNDASQAFNPLDVRRFEDARLQLSNFSAAPAAFSLNIQHSLDRSAWSTITTLAFGAAAGTPLTAMTSVLDVSSTVWIRVTVGTKEGSALTCTAVLAALTPKAR